MTKRKIYLVIQTLLYILLAALLVNAAIGICREGLIRKAQDPSAWIYTREIAAQHLTALAPLFFAAVGMTAVGWILGIKWDGKPSHAVKREKACRHAAARGNSKVLQIVLLVLAVSLIAAGILNKSAQDVFVKAAAICTECIGLG